MVFKIVDNKIKCNFSMDELGVARRGGKQRLTQNFLEKSFIKKIVVSLVKLSFTKKGCEV